MSQGHTIPLLYLARLLSQRGITVTIITTPANYSSIGDTLQNDTISIVALPFPQNIPGVPPGVEITDKLPSMSSFIQFVNAMKLIQPQFEAALQDLKYVSCIISDGFLPWTQESAAKLGIPRLVFYGTNNFSMTMCNIMAQERPHALVSSEDETFSVPNFPKFKLTVNDFEPPFSELEPKGPTLDFILEQQISMSKSHGLVVNSFYELEPSLTDYWNQNFGPKAWCIGPLCLAKPPTSQNLQKPTWIQWLDIKLAAEEPVLYVSFGTQAEATEEQLREIAIGLEQAEVSFLWALKSKQLGFLDGFEERVKGRGMVVKEWVDQMDILQHESICGFLSHCGWNSMSESICAGVPVLALPLMAEQPLNARMVVEDIGAGLRLWPRNMSVRGLVRSEEVSKKVKILLQEEEGKVVTMTVKEVREAAYHAMTHEGSSWSTLNLLIEDICGKAVDLPA